ncbi:hypothetical protein TRICI_000244 [Trichomonascus ciferrii]|uniref:Sugar phosphate transporter domain-containing protein n=1 Tax=Trichomonascus ciferrii TaxID=44093 RepID=A0A642VE42_9ASCO|nr:hypothetical protein TRICI_000244 [Trichomonascus ciferrii]
MAVKAAAFTLVVCSVVLKKQNLLSLYNGLATRRDLGILVVYSLLYAVNTFVALKVSTFVSTGTELVIRSTTPLLVLALDENCYNYTWKLYAMILALVGFCTISVFNEPGLYYASINGLVVTVSGAAIYALQLTATNWMLACERFGTPIELVMRIAPLVLVQSAIYTVMSGELTKGIKSLLGPDETMLLQWQFLLFILLSGLTSCLASILAYKTNLTLGPTITAIVGANVKHALIHLLAILLFAMPADKPTIPCLAAICAVGGYVTLNTGNSLTNTQNDGLNLERPPHPPTTTPLIPSTHTLPKKDSPENYPSWSLDSNFKFTFKNFQLTPTQILLLFAGGQPLAPPVSLRGFIEHCPSPQAKRTQEGPDAYPEETVSGLELQGASPLYPRGSARLQRIEIIEHYPEHRAKRAQGSRGEPPEKHTWVRFAGGPTPRARRALGVWRCASIKTQSSLRIAGYQPLYSVVIPAVKADPGGLPHDG